MKALAIWVHVHAQTPSAYADGSGICNLDKIRADLQVTAKSGKGYLYKYARLRHALDASKVPKAKLNKRRSFLVIRLSLSLNRLDSADLSAPRRLHASSRH